MKSFDAPAGGRQISGRLIMTGKQDIFKVVHAVAGLDWKTAVDSCVEEVGPLTRADRRIYLCNDACGGFTRYCCRVAQKNDVTLWVGTAANGIISGANEYALWSRP